jgi:hypothetical protein
MTIFFQITKINSTYCNVIVVIATAVWRKDGQTEELTFGLAALAWHACGGVADTCFTASSQLSFLPVASSS